MGKWWEENAARWEREKHALDAKGITYVPDQNALRRGALVLNLSMIWDDQPLRLVAHFPTAYPYFPPMVMAPDLRLARHQTPGTNQLCLLHHGGEQWAPETDTLATLLTEQLPKIFAAQPGGSEEENQGQEAEPITAFLNPEPNSFIGFPSYTLDELPSSGTFRCGLESLSPLRGTVVEVLDSDGRTLFSSEARDESDYVKSKLPVVTGRWVRIDERPPVTDAKAYYQIAVAAMPALQQPLWGKIPSPKAKLDLIALLFSDELAWQAKDGNVIVVSKTQQVATDGARTPIKARLHRTELESRSNYFMRDPSADGLQKGHVTLVGAGSIGSPAAKLLAQGGLGFLRVVDPDVLDAGNAIRWEIGRSAAGLPKVVALHQLISANFPYTKVEIAGWRIGDAQLATDAREPELYDQLFRETHCLFDATASITANQFLSEQARALGVPYVWMHATHGGWAGLVGRAGTAPADFCWMCHLYYLNESRPEAIKIPPLPHAPDDQVQPPGCLDPTFIGAQVDLAEVSLMGTRLVRDEVLVRTGAQAASAYPWNVAVVRLRDEDGRPQLPAWKAYALPVHPECPNH